MVEAFGLRPALVLPGPPAPDLDVVLFPGTRRRLVGRDVGQVEQSGPHRLPEHVHLGRRSPLLFAELSASGAQLVGPGVVAGLLGLPDLARQLLGLGPHRFGPGQLGPVGHDRPR